VRQLADAGATQKLLADGLKTLLNQNSAARELLSALGVDPLKDVDTITLGGAVRLASLPRGMAIVRGRYDLTRIQAAADDYAKKNPASLKIQKQEGKIILEARDKSDKKVPPVYAAFLDPQVLVLSLSRNYVVGANARQTTKKEPVFNKALQALVGKV